jgi:hypothetical protein
VLPRQIKEHIESQQDKGYRGPSPKHRFNEGEVRSALDQVNLFVSNRLMYEKATESWLGSEGGRLKLKWGKSPLKALSSADGIPVDELLNTENAEGVCRHFADAFCYSFAAMKQAYPGMYKNTYAVPLSKISEWHELVLVIHVISPDHIRVLAYDPTSGKGEHFNPSFEFTKMLLYRGAITEQQFFSVSPEILKSFTEQPEDLDYFFRMALKEGTLEALHAAKNLAIYLKQAAEDMEREEFNVKNKEWVDEAGIQRRTEKLPHMFEPYIVKVEQALNIRIPRYVYSGNSDQAKAQIDGKGMHSPEGLIP